MIDIKEADRTELNGLVKIFKQGYKKHGIFEKSNTEILDYLQKTQEKEHKNSCGYIIALFDDDIVGGLLLSKKSQIEGHALFKIKHLAIKENFRGQGIGSRLLDEAEEKIRLLADKQKFESAKVEVYISENESHSIAFYERHQYKKEGELKDHYRKDEAVFIMGKII